MMSHGGGQGKGLISWQIGRIDRDGAARAVREWTLVFRDGRWESGMLFAMSKQYFYFRLIPPRATFPQDITAGEAALMQRHADYFEAEFRAGRVIAYGPVLSPQGAFGLAILEMDDEAQARAFGAGDPSVIAGLNRFEFFPMRLAASRAKQQNSQG